MGRKPLEALKNVGEALYDEVLEIYKQLTEDTAMKDWQLTDLFIFLCSYFTYQKQPFHFKSTSKRCFFCSL